MLKTLHALDELRVRCVAGSRCMIAVCDLAVKNQTPGEAVQACVGSIIRSPILTSFGS